MSTISSCMSWAYSQITVKSIPHYISKSQQRCQKYFPSSQRLVADYMSISPFSDEPSVINMHIQNDLKHTLILSMFSRDYHPPRTRCRTIYIAHVNWACMSNRLTHRREQMVISTDPWSNSTASVRGVPGVVHSIPCECTAALQLCKQWLKILSLWFGNLATYNEVRHAPCSAAGHNH